MVWPLAARYEQKPYNTAVPIVVYLRPAIRRQYLSSKTPVVGTVSKSRTAAIGKAKLYQISGIPCSITSHCEKYRKNTIEIIEFAKSYKTHKNTFLRVFINIA